MTLIQILLPFLFCGYRVTNILYLIFYWNDPASKRYISASNYFCMFNGLFNFCCAIFVYFTIRRRHNVGIRKVITYLAFYSCIFPGLGILFFLIYSKFFDLMIKKRVTDDLFNLNEFIQMFLDKIHICGLFLDALPQLIIQALDNSLNNKWNDFGYISISFTISVLVYEIFKFILCRDTVIGRIHREN